MQIVNHRWGVQIFHHDGKYKLTAAMRDGRGVSGWAGLKRVPLGEGTASVAEALKQRAGRGIAYHPGQDGEVHGKGAAHT